MIALVKAIQPTLHRETDHDDFRPYLNEGKGDFVEWAQENPQASFRRFQIRDTGERFSPDVTNTDVESCVITFEAIVSYPQTMWAGDDGALERDAVMDADERLLGNAIGLNGYPNFVGASVPNASLTDRELVTRVIGQGVDFLFMRLRYYFYRTRT